jgi:hypothetical protein
MFIRHCLPLLVLGACGSMDVTGSELQARPTSEVGPYKQLTCHGETFDGIYEDHPELLGNGAYTVWCYDDKGKRVARMDHGTALQQFNSQSGTIEVTVHHFDDRNDDGELEAGEEDGRIDLSFIVCPASTDRVLPTPTFSSVVVALEIPRDGIVPAGWFAGTEQVVNRTNVDVDLTQERVVRRSRYSSLTFLQRAELLTSPCRP